MPVKNYPHEKLNVITAARALRTHQYVKNYPHAWGEHDTDNGPAEAMRRLGRLVVEVLNR